MTSTDVLVEVEFTDVRFGAELGYGVGRIRRVDPASDGLAAGERVLAPWSPAMAAKAELPAAALLKTPTDCPELRLMAVPHVAYALSVWEAAALELGELAAFTAESGCDDVVAQVASWRSGRDVLRLSVDAKPRCRVSRVRELDACIPLCAIEELQRSIADAAGFAAVIFSPRAEFVEILLEAMPVWGRVVIATAQADPATVDFYNNVHRKGVRVLGVPSSPRAVFDPQHGAQLRPHVDRAMRIVASDHLSTACLAAFGREP